MSILTFRISGAPAIRGKQKPKTQTGIPFFQRVFILNGVVINIENFLDQEDFDDQVIKEIILMDAGETKKLGGMFGRKLERIK